MVVAATASETSEGTAETDANVGVDGGTVDGSPNGCSETVPEGSGAGEKPGGLGAEFPASKSGAAAVGPAVAEDEDAQAELLCMPVSTLSLQL